MTDAPQSRSWRRVLLLMTGGATLTAAAAMALMTLLLLLLLGGKHVADGMACDPQAASSNPAELSASGRAGIPAQFLPLYVAAAAQGHLGSEGWLWLAAIHKVETDQNRNVNTSSAGAQGPMQFMPDTFRSFGVDGDADGRADIQNTADAIYSAANYLHASGAPGDWHKAVFAYNHAEWYYQRVLGFQIAYRGTTTDPPPETAETTSAPATPVAASGAEPVAAGREGRVAYALAGPGGQILSSYRGDEAFPGASITKAMLLIARLTDLADRPIPTVDSSRLAAMITRSDNTAANAVWHTVGPTRLREVAAVAGMLHFQLRTDDPVYRLGNSQVTAADQARLFAQFDRLLPARHRAYGLSLLSGVVASQRWGIWAAGLTGPIYAKGGWRPEPGGYITNQAGQIQLAGELRGLAVLTQGPGEAYGHESIRLITQAIAAQGSGNEVEAAPGSTCAPAAAASADTELATVPGPQAQLNVQGLAVAPQEAPAEVKAILAAGNQIVGRPYLYGGGHGPPLSTPVAAYDCSSAVSFILHRAGLFASTTAWVSGAFARDYGEAGPGGWVTLRANAGHIYMYVAGLRWDTHRWGPADRGVPGNGWHTAQRPDTGFTARHPAGL